MAPSPDPAHSDLPAVAIVLVNWNNWQDCIECIDSLLGMDYPDFHVFLVDNDSGDQSVEKLHAWCRSPVAAVASKQLPGVQRHTDVTNCQPITVCITDARTLPLPAPSPGCRLSLIRSGGNLGFAGGCNMGIRNATPGIFKYFWLLNTDTVVDRHALQQLVRRAQADTRLGMVGSTVLYHDKPQIVQAQAGAWMNPHSGESRHIGEGMPAVDVVDNTDTVEQQLTYIFGASMLVSRALIRQIGPMQEDYFLYYEEMDWAMRSREHFRFGYAPRSLVYHKSGNSSSKTMPMFTANLFYRNRIRFMSRFFPHCLRATKRALLIRMLRSLVKGHWAEARLIAGILYQSDRIACDAIKQSQVTMP